MVEDLSDNNYRLPIPNEHSIGRTVLEADGQWHAYCTCGDKTCAEDWDLSGEFVVTGSHEAVERLRRDLVIGGLDA